MAVTGTGNPQGMKPHAHLRAWSAVVGSLGVVGMAVVGVSVGVPATGQTAPGGSPDEVTTTTSYPASFRPVVTATVPPPPLD